MRAFLIALAWASILDSAVAQVPPGPPRELAIVVPPAVLTTTAVGPSANPSVWQCHGNPTCTVPIFVTVDTSVASGKKCTFTMPSFVITKHKHTQITWALTESGSSTQARFGDHNGLKTDGIYLYAAADFKNRTHQPQSFGWERDKGPGADEALAYFYDVNVEHNFGGGKCDVPDPIIVNMD